MNIEELKRLAAPLVKWGADSAWENPGCTAAVGYIDEDGNRDPILTVDTTIYDGFEGDSLELANFYAAANPAAVLELIAEVDRLRDEVNGMTGTLARIETERNNQILRNHNLEIELRECRSIISRHTVAPEPVRQPYDTVAILRRNVADLELALRTQTERAESYAETLRSLASYVGAGGYNADTVDAGVFEEKIRWGIGEIMTRAEAAEAELARLREQKPVRWHVRGNYFRDGDAAILFASMNSMCGAKVDQLFAAPVPVPHKGATHCDDYGLTWLDDGLNPLRCPYCKDAIHAPAVPSVVFMAHNKTSSILFAARKDADQYAASFGPAAGVSVTECAVIGSQSAPQAPAVPEQKPIWSGWSVWFKGGDGLFPAHFLHDSYGIPLRYPTRFDAAEKIKRHTRDSRELYEPREYSLYDAPQAPAVPSGCVAYLAQLADDPCQCHCCRTKRRKASALLQSAEVTK